MKTFHSSETAQELLDRLLNRSSRCMVQDGAGQHHDAVKAKMSDLRMLADEVLRLEGLVYVPGLHKCKKCNFGQISSIMHAGSGAMKADNKPQDCPNGCGPLWRVTERDAGNDLADRLVEATAWNFCSEGKFPTHVHSVLMCVTGGLLHHGEDYVDVGVYINGVWRHEAGGVDLPVVVSKWRKLPPF